MMSYGMPYMGSKQEIVKSIAMNFPKAKHFYDIFGGGGSVTHYMMTEKAHRHEYFHYNELNNLVYDLFKRSIAGEFSYDRFKPEWISRDDFFRMKESNGYVKYIWSFGNEGSRYLFGKDIEEYKKSMHMAIVFDEFDVLAKEVLGFTKWPSIANTIAKKRIFLRQKVEHYRKTKIPKCLLRFLNEKQLAKLYAKDNLKRLEQIERLQRLQQLEQLQRLQRLTITNCDYRDVLIEKDSAVYCDIPYKGTTSYEGKDQTKEEKQKNAFNHNAFYDWAMSRDFPVFVSEYLIEDKRFKLVYDIEKISLLQSGCNSKVLSEKLYWNGVK